MFFKQAMGEIMADKYTGNKSYIAIDLKSFYASVECHERNLDPLTTNLVVADISRTEKTICLAVSPSLKSYGIPGRARLFEVMERVREVNAERKRKNHGHPFTGKSVNQTALAADPSLAVDFIIATPQMAHYIKISTDIYHIYLQWIAPEDIHVYSIDEVFMDVAPYLNTYAMTPHELCVRMIHAVMDATGITATAGIGTNLYLAKIAMDIVAKHIPADQDGVRIAELDEMSFRRLLWTHRPLTDFWRVGGGYIKKLSALGLYTMGDIARCSLQDEDMLYKAFGVNAELLIDHAWGYESCGLKEIKAYRPEDRSLCSGQVLHCPYDRDNARLIVKEMIDALVLDLVDKRLVTDQLVLDVGYDIENLTDPNHRKNYHGPVKKDLYGRMIPKPAHGSVNLPFSMSSGQQIITAVTSLFDKITDPVLTIRRINITACHVKPEEIVSKEKNTFGNQTGTWEQLDLFTDYDAEEKKRNLLEQSIKKERKMQDATLEIKKKFGHNAVLRGMNFLEGATMRERNMQIGGHKA